MAFSAENVQLSNPKFHGKEVYHWRGRLNTGDLTGDLDVDYISRTWSIYENIWQVTREPAVYKSSTVEKLKGCRVDGDDFACGIPNDDLIRGLLWHAVYKPFWNEEAKHANPTWSWASLSQRVGWPDYSSGKVGSDVMHVEDVKIANLSGDREGLVLCRHPRWLHSAQLSLTGNVVNARFQLHDNTKRKGSLTGPALEKTISCTMDCDFGKRDVYVLKMLTRHLENGVFCTHFMVLEAIISDGKPDLSDADTATNLNVDETKTKFCRRIGTAKLSHRAIDADGLRQGQGQRMKIVVI